MLSSLELAPEVGDPSTQTRQMPTVTDIVHRVADRFHTFADLKGIQLQVDVQELDEHFRDSEQLVDALSILMDNALRFSPPGGPVTVTVATAGETASLAVSDVGRGVHGRSIDTRRGRRNPATLPGWVRTPLAGRCYVALRTSSRSSR